MILNHYPSDTTWWDLISESVDFNYYSPTSPWLDSHSGSRPPHCSGFEITLRHTALGRTPLDEWSARRREVYVTSNNTHKKQATVPPAGFEPTVPPRERLQTHTLDRVANGTGEFNYRSSNLSVRRPALFISLSLKIHKFRNRKWQYCTVWVQQRQRLYGTDGEC
jgi:hypothetical protein